MKNTLLAAVALIAATSAAYQFEGDKQRLTDEFYSALRTNDFNRCEMALIEYQTMPYPDGRFAIDYNAHNIKNTPELRKMSRELWRKWIDSDVEMDEKMFKYMVRCVNHESLDLIEETIEKKSPSRMRVDHMVFAGWMLHLSRDNAKMYDLMCRYLYEKSEPSDVEPLAVKIQFALKYNAASLDRIRYDEKCFTYESDQFTEFYADMIDCSCYLDNSRLVAMAEDYVKVCTNACSKFQITKKLDMSFNSTEFTRAHSDCMKKDANLYYDVLYYLPDYGRLHAHILENYGKFDAEHVMKAAYFVVAADKDRQILSDMANRFREDKEYSEQVEALKTIIEKKL